jgi:protein disulfide-isomerase
MNSSEKLIEVEIWSDIMCPFCYLGKRRFEIALSQFPGRDYVSVVWKSFQLNPAIETDPSISVYDYLSQAKGITAERAKELNDSIAEAAKQVGLSYNFNKAVVANTFKAHILLHLALKEGKQNDAGERLFKAYFTDGKNVDDINVLKEIGSEAGLDGSVLDEAFAGDSFNDEVRHDFYEARQMGINSVPFFLFNKRYAVTGAQDPALFLQTLVKLSNTNS